jgi:hypothetical protein
MDETPGRQWKFIILILSQNSMFQIQQNPKIFKHESGYLIENENDFLLVSPQTASIRH